MDEWIILNLVIHPLVHSSIHSCIHSFIYWSICITLVVHTSPLQLNTSHLLWDVIHLSAPTTQELLSKMRDLQQQLQKSIFVSLLPSVVQVSLELLLLSRASKWSIDFSNLRPMPVEWTSMEWWLAVEGQVLKYQAKI